MLQQELLKRVIDVLEASGAQHMLVGSHASSIQFVRRRGWDKVDLWVLKDEPYARESFARRRPASYLGINVDVMAPKTPS